MALRPPETGGAWLARQSPEVQRQVLGSQAAVEAYRRGEVALSDFVGKRHDPRWGTSIYQKSWREEGRATRGAGLRGQGEPIRGVTGPHNPAAVRGPHGIWNEETIPVTEWEAPPYPVVLPTSLLPHLPGGMSPVLRWGRDKLLTVRRDHARDFAVIQELSRYLENWQYFGEERRRPDRYRILFPDENGRWYSVTIGPPLRSNNIVTVFGNPDPGFVANRLRGMRNVVERNE
jgi:hypothetical protein